MMQETETTITGKLDFGTWIHCDLCLLLEENNITEALQNGGGGVKWSAFEMFLKMIQTINSNLTRAS